MSSKNKRKLCENCNSSLDGLYSSNSGQKDGQLFSIKEILKEFIDNIFSFDSRFFITIRYLLTNSFNGPSITDIFMILGKDQSLERLKRYKT